MIYIGIDSSLNSTAVSIYKNETFSYHVYTNKKENYKWIKNTKNIINYNFHTYDDKTEFSENEIDKLLKYNDITNNIINDINNIVDDETIVYMEGFSYNATAGFLINLVEFGTLIKIKLLQNKLIKIEIIPPSSLKKYVGELAYEQDKKGVSRNENGLAAGSFKKPDMMIALLKICEKYNINNDYVKYLNENKNELLLSKTLVKPFEDINDAFLDVICHIFKK
jgi:hypothetical protein